ncbi:MAG: HDOD domain-containing protein [Actinomycetota bacterium]
MSNDRVTIGFRTLRLLDRRDSTSREVAEVIESDPRLGKQILKMARSPLCGIRSDDLTVERALVLLGFVTIRKLVVVSLCRDISEVAAEDATDWRRALWTGIASEEFTRRIDETIASEALMAGMTRSMGGSFGDQELTPSDSLNSGIDPARLDRFVAVGEAIAEVFIARKPGLPSTADIDEAIETVGMPALRDSRLAVDIRRGYDLYASLLA